MGPQLLAGLLTGSVGTALINWWLRRRPQEAMDYSEVAARAWERLAALEAEVAQLRMERTQLHQTIASQAIKIGQLEAEVATLRQQVSSDVVGGTA